MKVSSAFQSFKVTEVCPPSHRERTGHFSGTSNHWYCMNSFIYSIVDWLHTCSFLVMDCHYNLSDSANPLLNWPIKSDSFMEGGGREWKVIKDVCWAELTMKWPFYFLKDADLVHICTNVPVFCLKLWSSRTFWQDACCWGIGADWLQQGLDMWSES